MLLYLYTRKTEEGVASFENVSMKLDDMLFGNFNI